MKDNDETAKIITKITLAESGKTLYSSNPTPFDSEGFNRCMIRAIAKNNGGDL